MVENRSLGEIRREYLDLANKSVISQEFDSIQPFIEGFLTTIPDDSEHADEIKKGFDTIENKRMNTWDKLVKETEKMDSQSQTEARYNGNLYNNLEALKERVNFCWQLAMKNGLFNE